MRSPARSSRIAVIGGPEESLPVVRELAALGPAALTVIGATPGTGEEIAAASAGAARPGKDTAAIAGNDLVVLAGPEGGSGPSLDRIATALVREAPESVAIVAGTGTTVRALALLRSSRLPARQVLAAGGVAGQLALAGALARKGGFDPSQVNALVIGDEPPDLMPLVHLLTVAGIPLGQLPGSISMKELGDPWRLPAREETRRFQAARAAALIAGAVIADRRKVYCCGVWIEGEAGLPACMVTHPVLVGARGVEEIFPVTLTMEERTYLQGTAAAIEAAAPA